MTVVKPQENYDDIFTDDRLNIKSSVVDFAHLIEQDAYIEGGVSKVYSIAAEFGIGKTFFCEKLKCVLEKDNVQTIKMNIWEMDFYENPLMPILATLNEIYKKNGENLPAKIINSTLNFTKKSLAVLCEAAVKSASNQILDVDIAEVCKNNFVPENIYDDFKNHQEALYELKQSLIKWARKAEKPIVVIIDELDRCRPDYAVKTLEVLKHFFDVSGFVFVLALDEKQLESSVECLFGTNNFEGYKRKFINNTFLLPAPDRKAFTEFLYDKFGMAILIEKIQNDNRDLVFKIRTDSCRDMIDQQFMGIQNQEDIAQKRDFNSWQTSELIIKRYFSAYSNWFQFTLRKMEQVFDRLVMFTKEIAASSELFSPDLAVLLVCLHEFDISIYNKLRNYNGKVINEISSQISRNKKDLGDREEVFDRGSVPAAPQVLGYSVDQISSSVGINRIIEDNVDRFFNVEPAPAHPLKWIAEFNEYDTVCNGILNNQRIALIIYSKRDAQWENPKPDVNTVDAFDLDRFKQSYFEKMDFISHFE